MVEEPSLHAHDTVVVRCDYCQSREELPADMARRVITLRQRLTAIRHAQQALEAPALAIASLAEQYPRMIAPSVVIMVAVAGLSSAQVFSYALTAPATGAIRAQLVLSALAGPLQLGFMLVSAFGGAIVGLRQYAAELRPALEARPPVAGHTYRCRACGGDIDAGPRHGAFVSCPYCGAQNLLGKTSASHRAAQLEREIAEYRARAQGQQPVIAQAAERYKRRIRVVTGTIAVANVIFMFAASAVQQLVAMHRP